jgi:hypothetical protein
MPTWSEVLQNLTNRAQAHPQGMIPLDDVRREALTTLQTLTGRPTVVYASRWVQGDAGPEHVMVSIQDVHAFMEVLHGLKGPSLDLILHSSGGSEWGHAH